MYGAKIWKTGVVLASIMIAMTLSACSLLSGANAAVAAATQLAIEEGTALRIQSGCKATATQSLQQCYDVNAARILVIAQVFEGATSTTAVSDLQTALTRAIASLGLTPEESVPLLVFGQNLIAYVTPLVDNNVLTAAALSVVNQIATLVASVATQYAPAVVAVARATKKIR